MAKNLLLAAYNRSAKSQKENSVRNKLKYPYSPNPSNGKENSFAGRARLDVSLNLWTINPLYRLGFYSEWEEGRQDFLGRPPAP